MEGPEDTSPARNSYIKKHLYDAKCGGIFLKSTLLSHGRVPVLCEVAMDRHTELLRVHVLHGEILLGDGVHLVLGYRHTHLRFEQAEPAPSRPGLARSS